MSGKYYLHSLHKNIGAYVREPGEIQGFDSQQFFLVYSYKHWHITDANKTYEFLWEGDQAGGYLRIATKGTIWRRSRWQKWLQTNMWYELKIFKRPIHCCYAKNGKKGTVKNGWKEQLSKFSMTKKSTKNIKVAKNDLKSLTLILIETSVKT